MDKKRTEFSNLEINKMKKNLDYKLEPDHKNLDQNFKLKRKINKRGSVDDLKKDLEPDHKNFDQNFMRNRKNSNHRNGSDNLINDLLKKRKGSDNNDND